MTPLEEGSPLEEDRLRRKPTQPCSAGGSQAIVKKELTDVWMLHKLPRGCFKVSEQRARKVGLEGRERGTERPHVTQNLH